MAISNKINEALSPTNKRFNIKFILAEVFLITAGILIALAIDNWNTDRAEQEMIEKYLIQMHKEFYNEIGRIEGERKQFYKSSLDKNLRALKIIKNNQIDSISVLEKLLVGISNPLSTSANIPITKEFLKQNLLYKIKNENLKNELLHFRRQALHSKKITLSHPRSGDLLSWKVPLPEDMLKLLSILAEFDSL